MGGSQWHWHVLDPNLFVPSMLFLCFLSLTRGSKIDGTDLRRTIREVEACPVLRSARLPTCRIQRMLIDATAPVGRFRFLLERVPVK